MHIQWIEQTLFVTVMISALTFAKIISGVICLLRLGVSSGTLTSAVSMQNHALYQS